MNKELDAVLIGYNDIGISKEIDSVAVLGERSVSFRDVNMSFLTLPNENVNALQLYTRLTGLKSNGRELSNSDFIWPVLTYLMTYLTKRGLKADFIAGFGNEEEKLKDMLLENRVSCVVITTTVYVSPIPITEIVNFVRNYNKEIPIIIGGPYLSAKRKHLTYENLSNVLKNLGGDYFIFSSEGELSLTQLIKCIVGKENVNAIKNLGFFDGGKLTLTEEHLEYNPLAENMIDYSIFKDNLGEFVSVRTAKSCPFSCAFCSFPERAGAYKYLEVEEVEAELNAISAAGSVTTITFIDDTFNVPIRRFKEILKMMIRNNYQFKWNSYLRSDYVDDETLELMKESGCEGVFLGIESGSDTILGLMNKKSKSADYKNAIEKCRKLGILTYASIIIGFPGETKDTIRETIDFLNSVKPDFYRAQVWYADTITPIMANKERYSINGSAFKWSHFTMTSQEAAFYVEEVFMSVDESIWLPQSGFEFWSVFYLNRNGVSTEQLKSYLLFFSDSLRFKLMKNNPFIIPSELIEKYQSSLTNNSSYISSHRSVNYKMALECWENRKNDIEPGNKIYKYIDINSNNFDRRALECLCFITKHFAEENFNALLYWEDEQVYLYNSGDLRTKPFKQEDFLSTTSHLINCSPFNGFIMNGFMDCGRDLKDYFDVVINFSEKAIIQNDEFEVNFGGAVLDGKCTVHFKSEKYFTFFERLLENMRSKVKFNF